MEEKKKRAPGGGRKPIADKVVQIDMYVRNSDIEKVGGKARLVKLIRNFLKTAIDLKE